MRARNSKNPFVLLILLLAGLIIGGVLGEVLSDYIPILDMSRSIGLEPATLDLGIITLTFGFLLQMNLASLIGLVLAFFMYRSL